MVSRKNSLSNSRAISYIFRKGKSINSKYFRFLITENSYDDFRLAVSISKKNFKHAVTRNFVKRRIKHLIHMFGVDKTPYNIIVLPKVGAEKISFLDMKSHFQKLYEFLMFSQEKSKK